MTSTDVAASEAHEDEAPPRLAELDFTDLLICEDGRNAKLRGLLMPGADGEDGAQEPLVRIGFDQVADLPVLARKVFLMGQQEAEFPLEHDGIRYRVTRIESHSEVNWYALRRSLDPIPRLSKLLVGVNPLILQELGRIGAKPGRGLILLAGSTGAGKTTTICSLLKEYLVQYGDIAVTIEDPPELKLEASYRRGAGHCYQLRVRDGDFEKPLRQALRMQPRYMLLGEIRDPIGAAEALRAGQSGHVVLSTIHGGSIEEAVQSMLKLVSARLDLDLARQMLADGLAAVLHQDMTTFRTADRAERRIKMKALFLGSSAQGPRSKIREGRVAQLADDIEQQAILLSKSRSPLEKPAKLR